MSEKKRTRSKNPRSQSRRQSSKKKSVTRKTSKKATNKKRKSTIPKKSGTQKKRTTRKKIPTIKKSSGSKKKATTRKSNPDKKESKAEFWLNADLRFEIPPGLHRKGNFLIWTEHPWTSKGVTPAVADISDNKSLVEQTLSEDSRASIKKRAQELARQKPRSISEKGEKLARRTRFWKLAMPQTGRQREALAAVAPESFLVYELVPRKTWGPNQFKVLPKFPIVAHLPTKIEKEILTHKGEAPARLWNPYIAIDIRGLNAAKNRARQNRYKYGEHLLSLIETIRQRIKVAP
jgi:hypothetical protein